MARHIKGVFKAASNPGEVSKADLEPRRLLRDDGIDLDALEKWSTSGVDCGLSLILECWLFVMPRSMLLNCSGAWLHLIILMPNLR
jgi:hypothetical protein